MDFIDPKTVPPEAWAQLREFKAQMDMATSRLLRVVAIGKEVDVADVRVELIALEVRDAGAILYWKAFPAVERMLGEIRVTVTDELGTEYTALPAGGGGGGHEWKGELLLMPTPPPDARVHVQVLGFAGFGMGFPTPIQTPVEGTWEFDFGQD